jgi:plastocyanin
MNARTLSMLVTLVTLGLSGCGGGGQEPSETASTPPPAESAPAAPSEPSGGGGPTGTAAIAGTVKYEGAVPTLKPLSMDADPNCAKKHSGPVASEVLVLGDGQTLGNVFVRVKSGLPAGATYAPPSEPVTLDQQGCHYVPHVLGVMVNQKVKILNSDALLHNIHALPKENAQFNMAMPANRTEAEQTFSREEFMVPVKCDVHPWMQGYIGVSSHPFFAVTGKEGTYEIKNLPAGTYELEFWHERLGTKTATVTVGEGARGTGDMTFTRS